MIALIQFITKPSGLNELKCFYEASKLPFNSFLPLNITSKYLDLDTLKKLTSKSKGVIMGGNSEDQYPDCHPDDVEDYETVKTKAKELVQYLLQLDQPLLGVCFGHQIIAESLGEQIVTDPTQIEIGFGNINLTQEGKNDPLFEGFDSQLPVIMAHKDSIQTQPKNSVILASSPKCNLQALKFGPKSYGVQFHPELLYEDFLIRQKFSPEYQTNLQEIEKPQTINNHKIIQNFIQHVIG
jgi:GMP synthase-like glutamine amidotransferase